MTASVMVCWPLWSSAHDYSRLTTPLPFPVLFFPPSQRIVRLNRKKGLEDPALQRQLRLSVEPGGCSGFSYKFELEDASEMDEESDVVIEKDGFKRVFMSVEVHHWAFPTMSKV